MTDEASRIVLADSTDRLADRLEDVLVGADFAVDTAPSAADCLRRVEREAVDGVVSTHALPDLDGIRLLRSIRVSYPAHPFVLVPVDGSEALASDAVAAGASGYVPADADPARVVSRLSDAIDRDRPWLDEETSQRYRHLVEASPAPINLFDGSGEAIWCNDAVVDLLDLDDRYDLIGHSIFEFVHPDDRDLARSELAAVVDRKQSVGPTRMKLERRDGETRHVQISTTVGRFLGEDIGQAVIVDVTPFHEARNALRDEQRFVEQSLDALTDVFYVVDADGDLLRWNEAVGEVTGYDDDELASMNVASFFDGADAERVLASIETVLDEGTDTIEATLVTDSGRTIPYEFRGRRLPPADEGTTPRVVGIGRDVSDREERKRQFEVLERWLRHNIRNDMNVVSGIAENLRKGRVDDAAESARRIEERTRHLVDQADRERRLVALLRDPPDPEPIDVVALVEGVLDTCRERRPSADIDLVQAEPFVASAIPDLRAAIEELVTNAVENDDAETPTVEVEVVADPHGEGGVVRVRDEGPGIPDVESASLRHDQAVDQLHHGSGLGLVFVYWVTRLSEGDLDVSTTGHRGSTVTLTLPAVDDPPSAA